MTPEEKRKRLQELLKTLSNDAIENVYDYVYTVYTDPPVGTGEWVNPPWDNALRCSVCGFTWYPRSTPEKGEAFDRNTFICPKGCQPDKS